MVVKREEQTRLPTPPPMGNQAALCRPAMDFFTPPEARVDYQQQPIPTQALSMLTANDRAQQGEDVRQRARAVLDEDARELQMKKLQNAIEGRRKQLGEVDKELKQLATRLKLTPKDQLLRTRMKGLIQKKVTLSTCVAKQEAAYSTIETLHQEAENGKLLVESQSVIQSANRYLRGINASISIDDIVDTYDDTQLTLETQSNLQLAASRPLQTASQNQLSDDQMEEALSRYLEETDADELAAGAEPLIELDVSPPIRSPPQPVSMTRRPAATRALTDPLFA